MGELPRTALCSFSTLQVRPPLTASHVVGVLETRSQYIDQALLTLMILLPQFSPVLKSQVLSAMPPRDLGTCQTEP